MNLNEVDFSEATLENLNHKPLIRDNLENIQKDFESIYDVVLSQDFGDTPEEALVKIKGDLFTAFCHGAQMATRVESNFRKNFVLPKEFGGGSKIITPDTEIIQPKKKLDLIL